MINFEIEFETKVPVLVAEIKKELELIKNDVLRDLAKEAPREIQLSLRNLEPPIKNSSKLYKSIQSSLVDENTVEIQIGRHAYYLDPFFEAQGGGKRNKPFIETGINKALEKIQ